jgi:lysosomal alpha-glucosidase
LFVYCLISSLVVISESIYTVISLKETKEEITGTLNLTSGGSPYGYDIKQLKFGLYFESETRLRLLITDIEERRWQVSPYVLKKNRQVQHKVRDRKYRFKVSPVGSAFFLIVSREDGTILFDTTNHDLIFSDPYLSIGTNLITDYEPNIYGLGERADTFRRDVRNSSYEMWNLDNLNWAKQNLYSTHPFYLEHRDDGRAHGVLLLNSNAQTVQINYPSLTFKTIGGVIDMFFFAGPSPTEVIRQYHQLIGTTIMPPKWALGFHQCRYGYKTLADLRNVVDQYIDKKLPIDVIWSIDFMNDLRDFTFDEVNYPKAKLVPFVNEIHDKGMKFVIMIDPGIKVEKGYRPYELGTKMNAWIKKSDGKTPIMNKVWPGITVFPDFSYENATMYWHKIVKEFYSELPFDGIWNDMNEIATFCNGECDIVDNSNSNQWDPNNPPYLPVRYPLIYKTLRMDAQMQASSFYNTHVSYCKIATFY